MSLNKPGSTQDRQPVLQSQMQSHLQWKIDQLSPWFHNLRVAGIETAPRHFLGDYPAVKYARFAHALPGNLSGRTVLDIGCNAGFYSMEMKLRGALRVLGIDTEEHYLRQARFAAEASGLDIEFRRMSVWDIGALGERFDLVIFMGVMYHLRHPLLALDLIHEHVCGDLLLFQSMQRGGAEVEELALDYGFEETAVFERKGYPRMQFVEQRYCNDETNWWIPNRACAEAMLRSSGFEILDRPEEEVYVCRAVEMAPSPDESRAVYPARRASTARAAGRGVETA